MRIRVQRGTNAGCKPSLKPRQVKRWACGCIDDGTLRLNAPYLVRCPDCGGERDARPA